jgi:molybdopterin adenylyltransferase
MVYSFVVHTPLKLSTGINRSHERGDTNTKVNIMKIKAISISDRKGIRKKNVDSALLVKDFGLETDAHGGKWHRQVSFLAQESIDIMREKGLDVVAGNFAENITTEGIDLPILPVGTHLLVGDSELIISQLGKVCHHKCAIYHQAGDCVMPREGIFAVVRKGGNIHVGDPITVLDQQSTSAAIIGTAEIEKELGDTLKEVISPKWSTAFVRFDRLNKREDNLTAILDDLIDFQQIDHVVIYDPSGKHQLALMGFKQTDNTSTCYQKKESLIYYCKNIEEVSSITAR